MNTEKRILFGIDASEFALQAVTAVGGLLANSKDYGITLFYGAPDPNLPFLSKTLGLSAEAIEEFEKVCTLEEQKVLDRCKEALTDSGFNADRVEMICEAKCSDPAYHLLQLATEQGFETLALGLRGPARAERKLMGSVAYKLAHTAEDRALWVIDPRISSRDVLVALVGAPISKRVVEHVVTYLSHLKDSKFTFFHVTPPLPPQYWDEARILDAKERREREEQIDQWMRGYEDRVKAIALEGKEKLINAGVPEENVTFKIQPQERGIARDILEELESNDYGILVIGRKGSKEIDQFGLGSKAHKMLHNGHALAICVVN
jgi:nucleotide-binding universal stress UspA family protein